MKKSPVFLIEWKEACERGRAWKVGVGTAVRQTIQTTRATCGKTSAWKAAATVSCEGRATGDPSVFFFDVSRAWAEMRAPVPGVTCDGAERRLNAWQI